MAWIFSLSAECGTQKGAAEAVAQHFQDLLVTLADGQQHTCKAGAFCDDEGWWACVCPDGVSRSGIRHKQDAEQMTEIGFALYERLRSSPPYRYALVGVEVDGFRYFRELEQDIMDNDFTGLVLADPIWQKFGSPSVFIRFAPGYHWRPFVQAN